ncbi:hypothetical protein NDU88_004332 [Pleurodeles waltl]|uniref:Uncharacterized protein n=1 Tax=Pleurodeles waltl TaxID=8319 RepID=A0AAV7PER0_PLEWA|nr:hypothetical protein NDU88_004332 [Pleurodeles waltl]
MTLDSILLAITDTIEALELKIEAVVADLGILRDDQRNLSERFTTAERSIEVTQTMVESFQDCITDATESLQLFEHHAEDAEGRAMCNFIRIVDISFDTRSETELPRFTPGSVNKLG